MRCLVSIASAWALLLVSGDALATFSIVAVDLEDGTVGGAVASCVALDTTLQVYGAVPGKGAVMTQSYLLPRAHDDALTWLAADQSPSAIVGALTDVGYDAEFGLRQYAVVSAAGDIANHSGTGANPFAGHLAFEVRSTETARRRFVVSAQGNFVTGKDVLERARTGFETAACDLPERLLNALVAAGSSDGGDARCTPSGTPAESALLAVDPPALPQGNYLRLTSQVTAPATQDPLPGLRTQFAGWRAAHPCAPLSDGAGGGSGGSHAARPEPQDGCRAGAPGSGSRGGLAWVLSLAALGVGLRRRYATPHPRRIQLRMRR